MIKRFTWILLAILALAIGAFFYLKHRTAKSAETAPTPTAPVINYLFTELDGPLTSIRIYDKQYHIVMLKRNPSGPWTFSLPASGPADQDKAAAAETQVGALEIVDILKTQTPSDTIGLAFPAHTVKLTFQTGVQHVLEIGDLAPTGNGYYVRLDGGKEIGRASCRERVFGLV